MLTKNNQRSQLLGQSVSYEARGLVELVNVAFITGVEQNWSLCCLIILIVDQIPQLKSGGVIGYRVVVVINLDSGIVFHRQLATTRLEAVQEALVPLRSKSLVDAERSGKDDGDVEREEDERLHCVV